MSWAIDETPGVERTDGKIVKLQEALHKANRKNILLFCAMPDKGAGLKNTTYPKSIASDVVSSVGAATSDGERWAKVGDEDPDFFLPGVTLGIPAESMSGETKSMPPEKWQIYSGSSLSCALACGLAAMILLCASKVESDRFGYLKQRKGMHEAFDAIDVNKKRWLRVSGVFDNRAAFTAHTDESKLKELSKIVSRLVKP